MKIISLIILLHVFFPALGQNQGNNWYFGDGAGISFNSVAPTSISGGQTYLSIFLPHSEASSSISDGTGSLLFYSNGEKAWNANHQIMPNGDSIMSNLSSTQGALIIPEPGSSNIYYLFTTDAFLNDLANGLRYSKVDMCLDNEFGDVMEGKKNIPLSSLASEKLIAVNHFNNVDYWIITHEFNSANFVAYRLTSSGIIDTITSTIGSVHQEYCGTSTAPYRSALGQLKASPDGSKLVIMNGQTCYSISELFDFDISTGIVSNPLDLLTDSIAGSLYGASFSPDNSKLYIGSMMNNDNIYQYDLLAGGGLPSSIIASKTIIHSFMGGPSGCSFQLGPDGIIYVARKNENFIGAINYPNLSGISCGYVDNAVSLGGNFCSYDLPNMLDSYNYHSTQVDCATGMSETAKTNMVNAYPNPVAQSVTFTLSDKTSGFIRFNLYNFHGELVINKSMFADEEIELSRNALPSGIYLYQIFNDAGTVASGKLIFK